MKTKIIIFLSLIIMTISATDVSAQGWLNKAMKKVDDVSKKIDKGLTKLDDTSKGIVEKQITNPGYAEASIKCTNPNLDIQLESCIREGKLTILSYSITNKGNDVTIKYLGRSTMPGEQTNTSIFDSEGNQYKWKDLIFGLERYNGTDWLAPVTLQEGIKVKCYVMLENVSSAAKRLQKVTIGGWDFYLQFNNVPVYSFEESLAILEPVEKLKIENPLIGKITLENTGIKAVTITDKFTRVDCFWKNTQFSPQGSLYVDNTELCRIEIDGEVYPLKQFNGIGAGKGDVWVNYNHTADFTYIFAPIPADTKLLNISGDAISFSGVNLKEKASAKTAATASFILSKEGLGCLKKGMLFSKIPAQCSGLYDRYEKLAIEDEMNGDYTLYTFYLGKEKVAEIPKYGNTVSSITAHSSGISTPDGVYPGMPVNKLLLINGVGGSYNEGIALTLKGYSLDFGGFESLTTSGNKSFNDAYAKGTEVKLSKACFKENAKVISISIY